MKSNILSGSIIVNAWSIQSFAEAHEVKQEKEIALAALLHDAAITAPSTGMDSMSIER